MKPSSDHTAGIMPEQNICHETYPFASLSSGQTEQFEDETELPSPVSESILTIDQNQARSENAADMEANASVVIVANENKPTHNCSKYEIEIAELKLDVSMLWATIHQMQEKSTVVSKPDTVHAETLAKIELLMQVNQELKAENDVLKEIIQEKGIGWSTQTKQSSRICHDVQDKISFVSPNRYDALSDEVDSRLNVEDQIIEYRTVQKTKYCAAKDKNEVIVEELDPKQNYEGLVEKECTEKVEQRENKERVLMIGDSMVKHIDEEKIGRAYRGEATCLSISGAKIENLKSKLNNMLKPYHSTIVIHVGTNDLVDETAEEVCNNLEKLVRDIKPHTENIAISSVIERTDGRISQGKIQLFNGMTKEWCVNNNVDYIDNANINSQHLNRSRLHLNRIGDRMLGRNLCTYLKGKRSNNTGIRAYQTSSSVNRPCFQDRYSNHIPIRKHRQKEARSLSWKNHLNLVRSMMTNRQILKTY